MLLLCWTSNAQNNPFDNLDTDAILQKDDDIPQVLLVGSFHFAYYGMDAHKTKEENKIPILGEKGQREVEELVAYIDRFKPNKIVVEGGRNSGYILRRYERYLADPTTQRANEIDQIAFRLMKKHQLDTLYGVDSGTLMRGLYYHKDSTVLRPILDSIFTDWDFSSDEKYSLRYNEWYEKEDEIAAKASLLDYFKFMNDKKIVDRGWGAYLVGDFKNGTYEGADATALHWYARNLRIFRNIQNVTEPGDRILVIFGAGHMTILDNLFDATPEYDLVRFGELENWK